MLSKSSLTNNVSEVVEPVAEKEQKSGYQLIASAEGLSRTIKENASHLGIWLGITIVTTICAYILWMLLQTETFLPYQGESFAPITTNIIIFSGLLSIIISGVAMLLAAFLVVCASLIRRKVLLIQERYVITVYIAMSIILLIAIQLHIFRIVPIFVDILLVFVVCGIVAYGKYRKNNRLKKYLGASRPRRV